MDFKFNEEQQMIINEAKKFAKNELEPFAEELDEKGLVNEVAIKKLGELGFLGMSIPEEYDGFDSGYIAYAGTMLELSKGDAGTSVCVTVQNSLVNDAIVFYGSEEQKKEYLPKLATGEYIGCFSLTEPNSGSDPGSITTSAIREGDYFILNGTKNFVTNGGIADMAIVFAQTNPELKAKGISAFLIKMGTPGFEIGNHENKMGIRSSSTTELILTDCKILASALLGEENKGLSIALGTLDGGRIGVAAQAIGIAEAALEESVKYSKERVQFGKPLSYQPVIANKIADMATEVELAKTFLFKVAWMKETKQPSYTKQAAMLKVYASEMSHRVCHAAVQIHGGYGYIKENKVERLYRDQRITEIYEGTSEIQRLVIGRAVLSE
jgi:alkylation response protein AidB-like acyl-CoA dehydrogenase